MIVNSIIFISALAALLISAKFFTKSAEEIGKWLNLPTFVIGVFIVGIGTSLPELISGIIAVKKNASEILPGNVIGANISNILLITGLAVVLNRKNIILSSAYIAIDLHFLLGSFCYFYMIAYDGRIDFSEAFIGIIIFIVYSIYLIQGGGKNESKEEKNKTNPFPALAFIVLLISAVGIFFGADYTIYSLEHIATDLSIPKSIIALTLLSIGTTLPELAVNVSAIKQGKAELALGNVLGSCVFNTLFTPAAASAFGSITVSENLLNFSLPLMAAGGLIFYMLTQDKRISIWEGLMLVSLYVLFIIKTTTI